MEKRSTESLKELLHDLHARFQEVKEDDEAGILRQAAIKKKMELIAKEIERRQQKKNQGFI